MKKFALLVLAVAAVAQLAVPASMIWSHENTLRSGTVWKFRTRPVDPVDFFRGRYVTLEFEAEDIAAPSDEAMVYGDAWVSLKNDAAGFAQVDKISGTKLKGDNVLKVTAHYRGADGRQQLDFPFDRLWMDEDAAPQTEAAYRELNRNNAGGGYVTVRIRDGHAVLEELYLNGKPVRQYLRERASR
jgi:uncharacterized membrane-anchored protein